MKNNFVKIVAALAFVILCCIPIVLVYMISDKEMEQYQEDVDFEFVDKAYGSVELVRRVDVEEYYLVACETTILDETEVIVPNGYEVMVQEGQEIEKDAVLASGWNKQIVAEIDGIVSRVEYGEKIKIYLYDFANMVYKCKIPEAKSYVAKLPQFYDESRNELEIVKRSNIMEDGYIVLYLKVPENVTVYYNQSMENMKLFTGNIYKDALVVDKKCVYSRNGSKEHYVRVLTEDGEYIEEREVGVGLELETEVCITGVEEGTYCDAGYGALFEEGTSNETNSN